MWWLMIDWLINRPWHGSSSSSKSSRHIPLTWAAEANCTWLTWLSLIAPPPPVHHHWHQAAEQLSDGLKIYSNCCCSQSVSQSAERSTTTIDDERSADQQRIRRLGGECTIERRMIKATTRKRSLKEKGNKKIESCALLLLRLNHVRTRYIKRCAVLEVKWMKWVDWSCESGSSNAPVLLAVIVWLVHYTTR